MNIRKRKKTKKHDLLELSKLEKRRVINDFKEKLRQRTMEAKLWKFLLELENLTINGNTVCEENQQLSGFRIRSRR